MKNNNNFNKNVKSVDTNDNNNNGDDFMKNNIDIMNKKTWKKLSKTDAYSHYAKLALKAINAKELAEEAKAELLANREEILKYQEGLDEFGEHIKELDEHIIEQEERIEQLDKELNRLGEQLEIKQRALDLVKEENKTLKKEKNTITAERDYYKEKSEELELENAKGIGKADASVKINEEIQAELQKQAESITADYEVYDDYTDELSVKAGMINNFRKDIKRNNKSIAIAKHDIKMGVAVNRNKKWIRDLEAQNRYLQNQINGFQATFNEFKTQKTVVSETIDTKRSNYEELQDAWAVVSGVLNKWNSLNQLFNGDDTNDIHGTM